MTLYNSVKFKDRKSFDKNKTKKNVKAVFEDAGIIVFRDRVPVVPDKNKVSHTYSFGSLKGGIPTSTVYLRARHYLVALDFIQKLKLKIVLDNQKINWIAIELPEHMSFERFHALAIQSDAFYMVEQHVHHEVTPVATNYTYNQMYQLPALRCQEAWDLIASVNPNPAPNVVTVLDWGCDINHPDLVGKTFNNFNLNNNTTNVTPLPGDFHGMGCVGLIVAADNGIYTTGVSPYHTKVSFLYIDLAGQSENVGGVFLSSFSYSIYHALQMDNCVATSHSYFYINGSPANPAPGRPAEQEMVYDALQFGRGGDPNTNTPGLGLLTICANANGPTGGTTTAPPNRPNYPASYDGALAVTATEPYNGDFRKTFWADYGTITFCAAPGSGTPSLAPNNETILFGGTSGACPIVAGVVALINLANPSLSANGIVESIRNSCRKIWTYDYNAFPALPGKSLEVGYGQIDAFAAVSYALSGDVDPGPGVTQNLRVLVSGASLTAIDLQYTLQYTVYTRLPLESNTNVTLTIFYSTDLNYTGADPVIATIPITMNANTYAYTDTYTFTIPNTLNGDYYFGVNASGIPGESSTLDNTGFTNVFVVGNVPPPDFNLRVEIDTVAYNEIDNTIGVSYELENTGVTPITTFTLKKGFVGYEERTYRLEAALETDQILNIIDTWSNVPPLNVLFTTPFRIEITSVNNLPLDDVSSDNISIGYVLTTPPTP
jgi:hypothetical protein